MLGVDERLELIAQFTSGCPAGGPWDVMLFSGGGNDIVDDPMCLWVKPFDASVPPASLIQQARFDNALALVRAGYEDLIAVRDEFSPATHLVFQCYDFALPDGRGICNMGPWLKPTFDLRGFPSFAARFAVMKAMLEQFALMLQRWPRHTRVSASSTARACCRSRHPHGTTSCIRKAPASTSTPRSSGRRSRRFFPGRVF